jgi:hypothetical protein
VTVKPATYDLRIPQRATLRERFKLPFSCVGRTVVAQIWNARRSSLLLTLDVEWIDQAEGEFYLYASRADTRPITKAGIWDLLVLDDADPENEGDYWLEGAAVLDTGVSDDEA